MDLRLLVSWNFGDELCGKMLCVFRYKSIVEHEQCLGRHRCHISLPDALAWVRGVEQRGKVASIGSNGLDVKASPRPIQVHRRFPGNLQIQPASSRQHAVAEFFGRKAARWE